MKELYIEKTIHSVISQTVLPTKWVIVSDGSTDRTSEIVNKYLTGNKWIELLQMPEHRERPICCQGSIALTPVMNVLTKCNMIL